MPAKKTGLVWIKKIKNKPSPDGRRDGSWSEKKKVEAVTTYLSTGNLMLTSRMCNIPYETLRMWQRGETWKRIVDELRDEESIVLDKKLEKVVNKALDAVNDRIDNGEYQYDSKTGKLVRVPVKLKDVHAVSKDLIDRRTIIQKLNNEKLDRVVEQTNEDRLLKLAETFATLALGKKPKEEVVIDGDYDAISTEREEGLPEGTAVGEEEQTESGESTCTTQCSESDSGKS